MKKILILLFLISTLYSNEYQEWLNQEQKNYYTYKKTLDEEFTKSLKDDWEKFKSLHNKTPYEKPKEKILPTIKNEKKIDKKDLKQSKVIKTKELITIKKPIIIKPTIVKNKDLYLLNFDFFSQKININIDKKSKYVLYKYDKKSISAYWNIMSKNDYKTTLKQFNDYINVLNLNDWAKYLLIYKTGFELYKNDSMANLFTWFYLTKMNYDTKIAYNDNNLYLLSTVAHKLFQVSFFTLKGKKYYVLTPNNKAKKLNSVYTYKNSYPNANKKLSFVINKAINFNNNIKNRELTFVYSGKKYNINSKYSLDLINFYNTFPQSDYRIYFDTKNSDLILKSLLKNLRPLIKGKKEIEAVNFLLRFVQTSFKYKTDKENFSYEKVLFPEETLFYSYSDCEDRSIMFSFLIKNLTNLDIVAVKYKNHLATAVKFSSLVKGERISYNQKEYLITDPTYINANAGMIMPQYKGKKYEIILIK